MYSLFSLLNILHFLNDGIRTMIISLLPFVKETYHLSLSDVGFIGSSQGLMSVVAALPGGILASKIGGKKLLFFLMLIYTVCLYLIGVSSFVPFIMFAYFLAAVGFAPFHVIGQALAARGSTKKNLGTNMSNFTLIGESGRIIIPAIALFVASQMGWASTIIGFAVVNSVLFVILYTVWQKRQRTQDIIVKPVTETSKEWTKGFIALLKTKRLLFVSMTGFLDNLGGNAIYVFLPFLLLAKGIATANLVVYMTAFFIGTFTGKVILGRAVDRFGNVKVLYIAEILMAVCLLVLTIVSNIVFVIGICWVLGVFTRGTTPVIATLYAGVSHDRHYEKVFAVSELFQGTAASLSPLLLGFVGDTFGIQASFYISAVLVCTVLIPLTMYVRTK